MRTDLPAWWLSPPLWFLGLEQVLGGGIIARVQGATVPTSMIAVNERMLALYRRHEPSFDALAGIALVAVGSVCTVAALSYAWNLRVLPEPAPSSRRRRSGIAMMATIVCGGDMVRRAGFRFALQALMRSAPHRLSMAVAAALAIAVSLALLSRSGFSPALNPAMAPGSVIAVQTVILTLLLAGFRRAVRVPAELQANWVLQISWRDAEARFLSGIKRAAIGGVAWPSLVALLPLHLWLMSERISALHLLIGACYSVVLVELLFLGCARVPFASNYEPLTNIKTLGPIVFLLFLVFTHGFTRLEQTALATRSGVAAFCLALLAVFTAARVYRYWRRPAQRRMTFDDAPEPATQWLGLSG